MLQRILGLMPARPNLYAQLRFVLRIAVTGLVLYVIITSGWFSLAGLLAGLSVIVANIITLSIYVPCAREASCMVHPLLFLEFFRELLEPLHVTKLARTPSPTPG